MDDHRIERITLYLVVLALAIAVGWLAFKVNSAEVPGEVPVDPVVVARSLVDCVDCEELEQRFEAVDNALGGLDQTVSDAVRSLEGLEGRVADAVSSKLLAEGCQVTKAPEECVGAVPPPMPPITVNSKFTFLYENARLNEEGEVARNSVGVKLAPRHLKRLQLLTSAFEPCHRADAPVEFEVAGYSSTAEFLVQPDGSPMDKSDELNIKTANLRAQIVGEYLKERFEVTTKEWPGDRDLERPYVDNAQPGVAQQALNRTVLIELKSAGACDLGP